MAPLLNAGPEMIPPGRLRLLSLAYAAELAAAFGAGPVAEWPRCSRRRAARSPPPT
jgi:hypothetical protein